MKSNEIVKKLIDIFEEDLRDIRRAINNVDCRSDELVTLCHDEQLIMIAIRILKGEVEPKECGEATYHIVHTKFYRVDNNPANEPIQDPVDLSWFKKYTILIQYKMKDDIEEQEKEFSTITKARAFYDNLYDEMLAFATMTDEDGNILEEKVYV